MTTDKKKICFINPGINLKRPISFLARILKKKGYKIEILTPRNKSLKYRERTRHYDQFKDIILNSYPVIEFNSSFGWPIPINFEFFKIAKRILKENDVIHVWVPFYPNTFLILLLKLLFYKKKRLILAMDTFPGYSFKLSPKFDPLFKIFYKTLGKIAYIASNYINIYANSLKDYALKAGIPEKKLIITPTGIDLTVKDIDKDIRTEFSIRKDDKIILYIGLINKRKGIDLIIKTAYYLRNFEKIKFVIVGDGILRERAIRIVKKLDLDKKIIFTGRRLDVHNFYQQADVFILPSRGEGLAGVIMEAMIYKVPVISSNIPGTRDIIENEKNGLLCEAENYKCYANCILEIINNPKFAEKIRSEGLKTIKSKFLWTTNSKRFEALYKI
ncbi:MAG: glycosyltransferase family 4 protein [Promethearchaeota archaeon]